MIVVDLEPSFKMTELGALPKEWEVIQLKDTASNDKNAFVDGPFGSNLKVKDFSDDGTVRVIQLQNIIAGEFIDTNRKFITDEKFNQLRRHEALPGDIVIAKMASPVGRACLIPNLSSRFVIVADCMRLRPGKQVDSYFIMSSINSPLVKAQALSQATGTTRQRISLTNMKKLLIPFPPLSEQQTIAHVLLTVQRAQEATEAVIDAAKKLKHSLMHHLFTYGPVPVNQADKVKLKNTEIGPVPEEWEVVKIGEICKGTQYGLSVRGNPEGQYPMLRMNNQVHGRIRDNGLQYVDLDHEEFQKFKLHRGDILFNRTNSAELVGKTALFDLDGDFVFASYLVRIYPNPRKMIPDLLNYYLNWNATQSRLKSLASRGVSQSNINATKLRNFAIPLPSLSEQHKIASILSTVDRKIETEQARKAALDKLFKSLLANLMTGKIRVKVKEK